MSNRFFVAATNVRQGRFYEMEADNEMGARFVARHLSKQKAGISFTAFVVSPASGAVAMASFLNGEPRFESA